MEPCPDPPLLPLQVVLAIRYWTALSVLAVFLSLLFYVLATSLSQSLWLFQISPKTFPFLCEPPAGDGVAGPGDGYIPVCAPPCPSPSFCVLTGHAVVPWRGVGAF